MKVFEAISSVLRGFEDATTSGDAPHFNPVQARQMMEAVLPSLPFVVTGSFDSTNAGLVIGPDAADDVTNTELAKLSSIDAVILLNQTGPVGIHVAGMAAGIMTVIAAAAAMSGAGDGITLAANKVTVGADGDINPAGAESVSYIIIGR